jgi:hypothetical protein
MADKQVHHMYRLVNKLRISQPLVAAALVRFIDALNVAYLVFLSQLMPHHLIDQRS